MSFICGLSGKVVPDGVKPVRVVTEWVENFEHPFRRAANRNDTNDNGGVGRQIKKEVLADPEQAAIWLEANKQAIKLKMDKSNKTRPVTISPDYHSVVGIRDFGEVLKGNVLVIPGDLYDYLYKNGIKLASAFVSFISTNPSAIARFTGWNQGGVREAAYKLSRTLNGKVPNGLFADILSKR